MPVALLAPLAAAAVFAPAADTPYTYRIEQTRTADGATGRYVMIRRLVFHRAPGGGWLADLTLLSTTGDAGPDAAPFARMAAALGTAPIRFRLDAAGTVTAVDDADRIWSALCDAVAAGDPAHPAKQAAAARTLAGFAPALRIDFLSSMLGSIIDVDDLGRTPGTRMIEVPAAAPGVPDLRLPGREQVVRGPGGRIEVTVDAAGSLPGARAGSVRFAKRRQVDAASGLVVDRHETRWLTIGRNSLRIDTTTTVTPAG